MLYLPQNIAEYSPDELRAFVSECDARFEKEFSGIARELCQNPEFKVLGLSGPTCSGKTTASEKLVWEFAKLSKIAHVISIDDFYLDKAEIIRRASESGEEISFESISAIDLDLLEKCISEIFESGETFIPKYDFMEGRRVRFDRIDAGERDIFIFEGIQVIYPEVISLFRKHFFKSLYISVESSICVGDRIFLPEEIRLLRRLLRDYRYRNSSAAYTLELWENVRENEDENIFPFASQFDYDIDSAMAYELCVLARPVLELLETLPKDNEVRVLENEKLSGIPEISEDYIPDNSLYREFI